MKKENELWIPPPFPFPCAWPHLFQTNQTTWLTPSTPIGFISHHFIPDMPSVLPNIHPSYIQEEIQQKVAGSDENDERNSNFGSSNSGESEYEYVLDEAWQERFLESVRAGRIRGPSTQEETLKSPQQRRKENKKKSKKKQQAFLNKLAKKKTNQDLFLKEKQTKLATAMAKAAVKDRSLSLEKNIYSSSIDSEDSERTRRRIEYLETTLNMAFDQFCDTNHPDVWPS